MTFVHETLKRIRTDFFPQTPRLDLYYKERIFGTYTITRGETIIVVGNRYSVPGSNPTRNCLHLAYCLYLEERYKSTNSLCCFG